MTGERRDMLRAVLSFSFAAFILLSYIPLKASGYDSALLQLAIFFISSIMIYFGGAIIFRRKAENGRIMTAAIAVIFVLYLALLVNFTVFDGNFGRANTDGSLMTYSEYFGKKVNLVPFKMIYRQTKGLISGTYRPAFYVMNVAGNLAAFAPTAFFLPALFKRCGKFRVFFSAVSVMIVLIEFLQFILRVGSLDVDDYILNILGASAAFALLSTTPGKRLTSYLLRPERRGGTNSKNN